TLGVPLKTTSSWRFVGMIWLIFRDGLARSMTGMLRMKETTPGWILCSFSSSRLYSAYISFCVFSASSLVFSSSCSCWAAAALLAAAVVHPVEGLLDLLLRELHLELVEPLLVVLPLAVVVVPDHVGGGEEQADGGQGKDHVEGGRPSGHLRVASRLRLYCHGY